MPIIARLRTNPLLRRSRPKVENYCHQSAGGSNTFIAARTQASTRFIVMIAAEVLWFINHSLLFMLHWNWYVAWIPNITGKS
jgi:hypothetical protein